MPQENLERVRVGKTLIPEPAAVNIQLSLRVTSCGLALVFLDTIPQALQQGEAKRKGPG